MAGLVEKVIRQFADNMVDNFLFRLLRDPMETFGN